MRELLTAGELRRRGWTGALIRQFAGLPDHLAVNPHHPGGPAMRLYRSDRITEIEASEQFAQAREATDKRKEAAQKALRTKTANAAASAAESIAAPVLPPAPRGELVAAAVRWFNECETWRNGAGKWVSLADPEEVLLLVVVEFIVDRLGDYRNRARPIALPVDAAAAAVDRKIIEAIAACYPWLSAECERRRGTSDKEKISGKLCP